MSFGYQCSCYSVFRQPAYRWVFCYCSCSLWLLLLLLIHKACCCLYIRLVVIIVIIASTARKTIHLRSATTTIAEISTKTTTKFQHKQHSMLCNAIVNYNYNYNYIYNYTPLRFAKPS